MLYDAFGDRSDLHRDWGLSLLVQFAGQRVLFDTGNDAQVFARNAEALGVDLATLDHVVISHRHGDHTGGLAHLLRVNPAVPTHVPAELFGVFGSVLPDGFYRSVDSLPNRMRYFGGTPPTTIRSGSPWPDAAFRPVAVPTEIAPGIFVVPTVSDRTGTRELRELSLVLRGERGLIVLLGCSHPGPEQILSACRSIDPTVHLVMGGLHLVAASDADIDRFARALRDEYRPDRIAPGHCTGEPAFAVLAETFGNAYEYAGVGSIVEF